MKIFFFTVRVGRPWHSYPEELWMPIPEVWKAKLEEALNNLE